MSRSTHLKNNIKTLRFLHGEMTQQQLADKLGLTRQTVAAIEQGKYSPSLQVAFKISRIFDKPIEEIFSFDEEWCEP